MRLNKITVLILCICFSGLHQSVAQKVPVNKKILETFLDAQNKPQYPAEEITALSGNWMLDGALITPNEKLDIRPKAPRLLGPRAMNQENGFISTGFDIKGLNTIRVGFVGFKADEGYFAVEVFVSKDQGRNWASLGVRRGDPTKENETIAEYKISNKKQEAYSVKIVNASAPKSNRLNRINVTEVQFEYGE